VKEEQKEREKLLQKYEEMKKEIISNNKEGNDIEVKIKRNSFQTSKPNSMLKSKIKTKNSKIWINKKKRSLPKNAKKTP
jgi:hypothetical protein